MENKVLLSLVESEHLCLLKGHRVSGPAENELPWEDKTVAEEGLPSSVTLWVTEGQATIPLVLFAMHLKF